MTVYADTISDVLGLIDAPGYLFGILMNDNVGLVDMTSKQYQAGALALDRLGLVDVNVSQMTYHRKVTDVFGLVGALSRALPMAIVDHIGFTGVMHLARAVTVMESLGLVDSLQISHFGQLSMVETLGFSDQILEFFGLAKVETLGLSGTFTASFQFVRSLSDTLGFTSSLTANKLFTRIVTDNLGLEDFPSANMIFNSAVIVDCVEFSIGTVDPGTGEFTQWAVNTRTNAITEYQGWGQFNSFCQIGNNYYGANSEGLWSLNAQTDDGANIAADIKGAMLSLGGSRYTQLDGVYIGMRVDDNARDFILKLIVPSQGQGGADKVYLYKFNPKDMRTTKINIGKGLRARYIQWELITPGPDFDLDSIEFVPVISKRRTN